MNRLYFADNLAWLRNTKELPDASVDLVYLDPPSNSNADCNRSLSGDERQGKPGAFPLYRPALASAHQINLQKYLDVWDAVPLAAASAASRNRLTLSQYPTRGRHGESG